ncbi:hypothetical protein ACH4E8_10630 [Streptomyces sp. NPDC017979]|uniref:SCO2583 family membrane protein n=1 Tax=Streptomyces sp. NPDC017979 TaxID=3365024 RepID=UPI00378B58BA
MAGRGDPPGETPGGTPEGPPGDGEDEYRSVVFDESFVRAARLQEYSARERLGSPARAVRTLPPWHGTPRRSGGALSALVLALLIAIALGTVIYLGVRHPHRAPVSQRADALRISMIPLVPSGPVPGGTPEELFRNSPAAQHRIGASGIPLPGARRTGSFSESDVLAALTIAKNYLVVSSLYPEVLTGGAVRPVRVLLDPDQFDQFDRSMATPAPDGRHAAAGWLIRFDPAKVALADPGVRVHGTLSYSTAGSDTLEVTSNHSFTYALRPARPPGATPQPDPAAPPAKPQAAAGARPDAQAQAAPDPGHQSGSKEPDAGQAGSGQPASGPQAAGAGQSGPESQAGAGQQTGWGRPSGEAGTAQQADSANRGASLFVIRRELRLRFDHDDLPHRRAELVSSSIQAGPQSCPQDGSGTLRPLLSGERAALGVPAGTDPYTTAEPTTALCGSLSPAAQPSPSPSKGR